MQLVKIAKKQKIPRLMLVSAIIETRLYAPSILLSIIILFWWAGWKPVSSFIKKHKKGKTLFSNRVLVPRYLNSAVAVFLFHFLLQLLAKLLHFWFNYCLNCSQKQIFEISKYIFEQQHQEYLKDFDKSMINYKYIEIWLCW